MNYVISSLCVISVIFSELGLVILIDYFCCMLIVRFVSGAERVRRPHGEADGGPHLRRRAAPGI